MSFITGKSQEGEFIQVITNDNSYLVPYIGGNIFTDKGIKVHIIYGDLSISGEIKYGELSPLKYDIMGPFKYLPMQCRHKVLSMSHSLEGYVKINGSCMDFTGGKGYIEGDSGISFPDKYLWIQCNDFPEECSIMLSIAEIPFGLFKFTGCICAIKYGGKEYRIATYKGVKILKYSKEEVVLQQGKYIFIANISPNKGYKLKAPKSGKMDRTILESLSSKSRFRFLINKEIIFDLTSDNVNFEFNN